MSVYFIAEIGINHEGSKSKCMQMILQAKEAGANAIKLQTVDPQQSYMEGTESFAIFSKAMLSKNDTIECFAYAKQLGIEYFTTAGDLATFAWVDKIDVAYHKISSGLFTHIPLIHKVIESKKPAILSTGLASNEEIDEVVELLNSAKKHYTLLHCVSQYPTPINKAHLSRMAFLKNRYNVNIGYSDHCLGIDVSLMAVAAGATMIEKHFSYDKSRPGFDHHISIEADEFKKMVFAAKQIEAAFGSEKSFNEAVADNRKKYLRCLVAAKKIVKGEVFSDANLAIKRPLPGIIGLEPKMYLSLLGKVALKNYEYNQTIDIAEFEK